MKFLKSISLFCLILLLLILLGYLLISPGKEQKHEMIPEKSEAEDSSAGDEDLSVSTKQNVTTCDTIYEVESYVGESCEHKKEEIPFFFIGLTREELIRQIALYEASPDFEDRKMGFVSMELISFHPEHITVRKFYTPEEEKIIYYLKAVDHELLVYRSDNMDEVFMPTDLTLEMLPWDVQQQVIATKCFNDIAEVYAFLESYTS